MLARRLIDQNSNYVGFVEISNDGGSPFAAFTPNLGNTWYGLSSLKSDGNWGNAIYGNGCLLLSNGGTDLAMSRNAGFSWTYYTNVLPITEPSLGFGNGVFVAVSGVSGYGSTAAYSTDNGQTWTASTLPVSGEWESVAYGNGVFVAIDVNGSSVYSTDNGQTWTASTLPSVSAYASNEGWISVAYGNGVFVAVNSGNTTTAYSTDNGQTWSTSTLPFYDSFASSVCYGNGMFVASANNIQNTTNNIAAYSTDGGKTWTNGSSFTDLVLGFNVVTYGNGVFMIGTGSYGALATSTNGAAWGEIDGGLQNCNTLVYVGP